MSQPIRRWGCFNRPSLLTFALMQDGWTEQGTRNMREVPLHWGEECKYTLTSPDVRCNGCKWQASALQSTPQQPPGL